MKTIRIFDQEPQTLAFRGIVVDCRPHGGMFDVVLDRTAFFPEGGGQMPDRGILGGQEVLDVQEKDGIILHTVKNSVTIDSELDGQVNPAHRLDMMQQHSGEHIFSGLVCRTFHCDNVGFHIGPEELTIDFNTFLSAEQVSDIERRANEVIWRDQPIHAWFPGPEELAAMSYRSKKALSGDIRIVEIEDVDCCACCGTHVATAGQVGQIKVTDCRKYKSGVRITLKCGSRALKDGNDRLRECREISHLTNAPMGKLAESVTRLMSERDELRAANEALAMKIFRLEAAELTGPVRTAFPEAMTVGQLRKAAAELAHGCRIGAVLIPKDTGWSFALSSETEDVRPTAKLLTERFGGKGGGPKDMVQGVLNGGNKEEIAKIIEETEF